MKLFRLIATVPILAVLSLAASAEAQQENANRLSFEKHIRPLLKKYCFACHGSKRPRGDVNLEAITTQTEAIKKKELWQRIGEVLQAGEMPPSKRPKPSDEERDRIIDWIDAAVNQLDCRLEVDPGRVTMRRLNRSEYNNTIRDLTGLDLRLADDFPDDDVGHGFDNIGDVLSLSPLLLERYLKASERIVEEIVKNAGVRKRLLFLRLEGKDRHTNARRIIARFAEKAYRRPVKDEEIDRLMRFVELAEKKGDGTQKGVLLAFQAVLVSPHFLFRIEEDRPVPPGKLSAPINDFELASRLSYFLWSTMPDEQLFELARQGKLRLMLKPQVARMLQDPKSEALVKNFAGQWLELRTLRRRKPDPDIFPEFDTQLREAMIAESEAFFRYIMRADRSVLEFLDADYTFVNERLAKHYGIPGIRGPQMRKVDLKNHVRGGLLTQAAILTVTSNPTRTSPVLRGKWILENILGTPPPPPPPNVPELDESPQASEAASLRKRLELHRKKAICASCHERMDALGFGLENFDGIGKWRERDGNFVVDASGTLPDGSRFSGPRELRQVLVRTKANEFRRCLVKKMLTYALGRGLEYYDRCAVDDICRRLEKNGDRFSELIYGIVESRPFLYRRGGRK